ncbi:hypothetical protein D8I35_04065 [Corticibacter populi]|uniref:Heme biosynthesis operon protein HemX n=1 Tax=Corticibacter populi TaxID=1550736 RepID=A0A3M6QZ93_9BURK|nr:uroporphyrinogen-III C-methyltransferase [Corticibacter populi]RMX08288.1 hypothetical protein D8I35_04065 [Corticibacter populi]RZS35568.1 uroporphyrin-3 C-methyltransferase [Corticibacter populi]
MDQPSNDHAPPLQLHQLIDRWRRPVVLPAWGTWLLMAGASIALLLAYSQWKRLNHIQEQLATQSAVTQTQAIEARTLAQQAQELAQDAAARAKLSEVRINEYTLQRSHLEQLAFELSRNHDEAMLVDIEASLRLAQQQAQLTGLADPLIAALRNASQRFDRLDQPRLLPVHAAIERDLARLTSTAVTDTAGLLGRIDSLLLQLEQLPLSNAVGTPSNRATASPEVTPATAAGDTAASDAAAGATESAASTASGDGAVPVHPGWMHRIWSSMRGGVSDLVRVQRIDHPDAALLTVEQAFFLRENLRLQLMNARMGLLARQTASARADLATVQALLLKYYDTGAPRTRHALQTLRQLQEHIQAVETPAITDTLAAIAAVHASRQPAFAAPAGASISDGDTTAEPEAEDLNGPQSRAPALVPWPEPGQALYRPMTWVEAG